MTLSRLLIPLAALMMISGPSFAQTATQPAAPAKTIAPAAPPAAKPATPSQPTTMSTDTKAAKSKACSAEADKQGLHGKARKKFRSDCKRR